MARWVVSKDGKEAIETFRAENGGSLAEDRDGRLVFLARNGWDLDNIIKRYPGVAFRDTVRAGQLKFLKTLAKFNQEITDRL